MGPDTVVGVLYQISNGGGFFNCNLEFSDSTVATVQLAAPDWYLDQTPPPPGPGVLVQRELGTFTSTQNQDSATLGAPSINVVEATFSTSSLLSAGLGDVNGKRLTGITFSDLSSPTVAGAIFAVTFRDAVANTSSTNPVGTGSANPNPAEQTRNVSADGQRSTRPESPKHRPCRQRRPERSWAAGIPPSLTMARTGM